MNKRERQMIMRQKNRLISILMVLALLVSVVPFGALAAEEGELEFSELGQKTAEALPGLGEYEITVSVPGAVSSENYGEVIVMADASSSMAKHYESMKTMIRQLGYEILHEDGSMKLTLMGFGMGPRTAVTFSSPNQLNSEAFDRLAFTSLRQGVSATNCEAALLHVNDYINSHPNLENTYVIFLSDGNANMDESVYDLTTWAEHPEWYADGYTKETIAGMAVDIQAVVLLNGGPIWAPAAQMYPEEAIQIEIVKAQYGLDSDAYKAAVDALYNKFFSFDEEGNMTGVNENAITFTTNLFRHVMEEAGLDVTAATTAKAEAAFMRYADRYANADFPYLFYCAVHRMNISFYPDDYIVRTGDTNEGGKPATWGARAAKAADMLASNSKVLELYMMDFSSNATSWMNAGSRTNTVTSDNITYNQTKKLDVAISEIVSLGDTLFTTKYNDVSVVDPMSKWVDLDPESIEILLDDAVIWQYGTGWLIDNPPIAEPITLEINDDGNYQITWKIKDGPLLYTDRYYLKYHVSVDETVDGFEYGKMYPANDPTNVEYTDENGNPQTNPVVVPEVNEPMDGFGENDLGLKICKGSTDGEAITGIQFSIYKVVPEENEVIPPIPTEEAIAKYMTEENYITTLTTDGHGYASYNFTENGFGEGHYLIVEHENEKIVAPVAPFYIMLPMENPENGEMQNVVTVYPKNELVPETPPPEEPEIPEEPEPEKKGQLIIVKHAEDREDILLSGAEFAVYRLAKEGEAPDVTIDYNGNEVALILHTTVTTGEDGKAAAELPFGLYFLLEVKAPAGYSLRDDYIPVLITSASTETAERVMISNSTGPLLPSTGGIGTTIFYILGGVLAVAAVILLVTKKRMNKEE